MTSRGKVLEYLGLTLDYSVQGKVKISMYDYMLVDEAPGWMTGVMKTPVVNLLFILLQISLQSHFKGPSSYLCKKKS